LFGCVNSIECAKTADLQAEPTLRTPHGNDVMTSVSLFDTSAHADESTRLASSWVRDEKLESALPNAPKIPFGEVIAKKTNGAVRA
jgi:hypothetical protein